MVRSRPGNLRQMANSYELHILGHTAEEVRDPSRCSARNARINLIQQNSLQSAPLGKECF